MLSLGNWCSQVSKSEREREREREREFSLLMIHMDYGIKKKKKKKKKTMVNFFFFWIRNYGKLIIDVSAKTRLPQTCLPPPRVLFVNKHQHVTHNIINLFGLKA